MEHRKIGFAFCGSFCTYSQAMEVLERVQSRYGDVLPIVSEAGAATDTRFGAAHDFMREMERICGRRVVDSIAKAEPIGPRHLLDVLVICPCTATPWPSWANGVTETTVTMGGQGSPAQRGPGVLCPATNDGLQGLGQEYRRTAGQENVYFVPFRQDDPARKPHLPGGRLFPGPSRYRRGAGGPPAPARAAWTAGGGLKNTPPPA